MSQLCCFTKSLGIKVHASALAALLFASIVTPAIAIDDAITQSIWKLVYNVTDAQIGDSGWLAADDDRDGVTNGAEIAAGTNPFLAGSTVRVTEMTVTPNGPANDVNLTFPTIAQKRYFLQKTTTLGVPLSWLPSTVGATWVKGDGTPKTLSMVQDPNTFYRVVVQDLDTDGDGVGDWAETIAGYDPNSPTTNGTPDAVALAGSIAVSNVVTVKVNKPIATQPVDSLTAPIETGSITVSRSGLLLSTITVPLSKSGTALEGTDYDSLPASVTLDGSSLPYNPANPTANKKVGEVVLTINPRGPALPANARKTNMTAIVKALAANTPGGSGNYTLGSANSGSVVIKPPGVANGTGLSGTYYKTANATYSNSANFQSGQEGMPTRTDATINFSNGSAGWGGNSGPTGMVGETDGIYSIRWSGQILPQYSETYNISFRSDDGAKVWVDGQLLIDRWATQSATEYVNTIALQGGVFYDIKIEYFNSGGSAEAKLSWWSASQTKEIIPMGRLFPAPAQASKPTAITSSLAAVGYVGTPFSFNVTSPNIGGTTTYALAPNSGSLPPGSPAFTLNASTGVITGTPTVAGTYNVAINATNAAAGGVTGSSILNITIFPVGTVTRETLAVNGTANPNGTVATLDDDEDYESPTSRRLRGYIIPPKTGNYYFWLAANNSAELWISNDSEYVNRVRRAYLTASSGKRVWNTFASQQSQWLSLVAGEKYYFEVLHNTGTGTADDYVSMAWCQDDVGTALSVAGAPNATGAVNVPPTGGGPVQGYPLSGTVPTYLFQPYDYPVVTPPSGTLYACNMGPQGAALTSASGSANIQVNAAETEAILHFSYQNLKGPRTAYHLHVDSFTSAVLPVTLHPQGEIIFDIDDADQLPALRTPDGGYKWDLTAATGSFSNGAQIVEAIKNGKVYLNIHSAVYPAGEIRGTFGRIDGSQTPPDSTLYPEPNTNLDVASNPAHAARFLSQATFGASPADVSYVQSNGFQGWITNQLGQTASRTSNDVVAGITADINNPYPSSLFTNAWWKNAIKGNDQLRQRLAFALSEIMVVSWANDTGPLARNGRLLADYYDQLVDYCLPTSGLTDSGNFRGILKAVTLTPAMGLYLDMRGNQKGDDSVGRHPNENYAREIMQLFSVGVYRMWDDGRFVLGSDAGLVATYTQPSIIGLSNLFTGWTYAQSNQSNGRLPTNFSPSADYLNPMVLVPAQHELGSKFLLNNVNSPAATGLTPRVSIASIAPAGVNPSTNPCTVTTSTIHGLKTGDTIRIAGVTGGTFVGGLTAINASFQATVTSATSFTVPVPCTSASGAAGTATGSTVIPAAISGTGGIAAVTGSQSDNNGSTLPHPYDQYGLKELDLAIDNIVTNDNVPPYICRQLIQRLVTSDPSPGYIYRVVQKFKNNGSGVRGDLAAVVSQILLDGEARSTTAAYANDAFGKQREPMLRLTGPARAFSSTDYTGTYTQLTGVNSNRLRIVTSAPNDFSSNFTVSLNFRGNYVTPMPSVPNPAANPTSTSYTVNATLGIAKTSTPVSNILAENPCKIVTAEPHGLTTGNAIRVSGFTGGAFSGSISTTSRAITVIDSTTFTVDGIECTEAPTVSATTVMVSNPCRITTVQAHGLITGDSVTISSSGGTFNPAINGATLPVTVVDATSFTVPSDCTAAATANTGSLVGANTLDVTATGMTNATYSQDGGSNILTVSTGGPSTNVVVPGTTVNITSITVGNPCTVTTSAAHNLVTGGLVTIAGITDGEFATSINGTFVPTFGTTTSFTVPVACTVAPTIYTAGTTTSTKLTRSRVYLSFLTQTTAGGEVIPTNGIFDVQTRNGTTSFTVNTTDTPVTGRGGNVLLPKFTTSYTPSGTTVKYNNNVNHNLVVGNRIWVDVPVVGSPVTDAEYEVSVVTDEDHFTTSRTPNPTLGGTYPNPSGSNNGITIYPLVPPPLGRSGVVTINQSTFNLGSTESTLTQSPLNAPTVFNYFFPDYKFPGTLANSGLDSPEFQLTTDTNVMNLTNSVTNMIIGTAGGNTNLNGLTSFSNGNGSVVMDIGAYLTPSSRTADANIGTLVDDLARLLVGGPLQTNTRTEVINFVANTSRFPYTTTGFGPTNLQKRDRVRAIIHLILTSAEYAVQK